MEKGNRPGPVFDFLVANAQDTKERLLAAGCSVVEENPSVPRCYIRDPFGLVFNIEQTEDRDQKMPPKQSMREESAPHFQRSALCNAEANNQPQRE